MVSIWLGLRAPDAETENVDILKGMCGVNSYDPDDQEVMVPDDGTRMHVGELLGQFSYSASFLPAALAAAEARGLNEAYWAVAQFDFFYRPELIRRRVAADPVFLGMFPWRDGVE
jgi:hypothetical protein